MRSRLRSRAKALPGSRAVTAIASSTSLFMLDTSVAWPMVRVEHAHRRPVTELARWRLSADRQRAGPAHACRMRGVRRDAHAVRPGGADGQASAVVRVRRRRRLEDRA